MSTWISSLPLTPDFFPILEIFMYTDIFVHNGFSFSSLLLYTFEDKYFKISEMEDVTLLTCCGQILTINVKF